MLLPIRPIERAPAALERMTGIEPAFSAWEADVLPLNYIRRARKARRRGRLAVATSGRHLPCRVGANYG